jgi:hypothetical protein
MAGSRAAAVGFPRIVPGEVPVMAGPGDERAAGAGGRGHLRASHADREQVIGTLQAAFVQGMLAQDDFGLRVGQALAARTYADLAALTAGLPAGLAAAQPPQPARAREEQKVLRPGPVIAVATAAYAGAWAYGLFLAPAGPGNPTLDPSLGPLIVGGFLVYLNIVLVSVGAAIVNWRGRRSGGPSPRRAAPGAGGQRSRRQPPAGLGGQQPPAGPAHQHSAEAAQTRRPRPLVPGWRSQAITGYLTHPVQRRPAPAANPSR